MRKDDKNYFLEWLLHPYFSRNPPSDQPLPAIVRKLAEFEGEKKSRNNQLKLFPVNQKDFLTLMG
jgi:hypothetical protein